jgi:hypothetical protein
VRKLIISSLAGLLMIAPAYGAISIVGPQVPPLPIPITVNATPFPVSFPTSFQTAFPTSPPTPVPCATPQGTGICTVSTAPPLVLANPLPVTTAPPLVLANPLPVTTAPPLVLANPLPVTTAPPLVLANPLPVTTSPPLVLANPLPVTTPAPCATNADGGCPAHITNTPAPCPTSATAIGVCKVSVDDAPSAGTITTVAQTVSSVTILASNAARRSYTICNSGNKDLYLSTAATATANNLFADVPPQAGNTISCFKDTMPGYTGLITGLWFGAGSGNAINTSFQ